MKVVVTGATSFIGAPLTGRLLAEENEVFAVIRPGSKNRGRLMEQAAERAQACHLIELELGEIRKLAKLVAAADRWVHIGWDGAGSDNRTRRDVQQRNVVQSLEAVRTAAEIGCSRFLFTGSQAEYGIRHELTDETALCSPVSEYGIAKVQFHEQAKPLCRELGMEYIHARIYSVYGPGDHPWSLIETCLKTWREGGVMSLGPCTQKWNFLYLADVVEALVCLLTEGQSGVYNIASTDTRPLKAYIEELFQLCGRRGGYCYGERPQNAEGAADLIPDIGKICRETGWRPTTTFAEGIYELLHRL